MRFLLTAVSILFYSSSLLSQALPTTDSLILAEQWQAQEDSIYVWYRKGKFDKSVAIAKDMLAWAEKKVGKSNFLYIKSLCILGATLNWVGNDKSAVAYLEKSKSLYEKKEDTNVSFYIEIINNLGMTYKDMGLSQKALPLLKESVDLLKTTYGTENYQYSIGLNNLSLLYQQMNNKQAAIETMKIAIEVTEKSVGKKHRRYSVRMGALANLYANIGEVNKAVELLESVFPSIIEHQGKEHPAFTSAANNLVNIYMKVARYEEARQLMNEVLEQAEKVYGQQHRVYGIYLHTSSKLFVLEQDFEAALKTVNQALAISKKFYGKNSRSYLRTSLTHSLVLEQLGQLEEMENNNLEIQQIVTSMGTKQFPFFSEKDQEKLLKDLNTSFQFLNSLNARHPHLQNQMAMGFNQSLLLKNILRTNHQNLLGQIKKSEDQLIKDQATEWNRLKVTLSRQYKLPVAKRLAELDSLEDRASDLERQLAFATGQLINNSDLANWQKVQAVLEKDEVAIEFCHFSYMKMNKPTDSILYVAYLLTSDAAPQLIPLFEEKELGNVKAIKNLYSPLAKAGRSNLRELIWQPLSPFLKGKKKIYFSPSGLLHRINLGAIPINDEQTIAETYQIQQLGSSSELLKKQPTSNHIEDAILYGGIQYDLDSLQEVKLATANQETIKNGYEAAEIGQRGGNWKELLYSKKEVKSIQETLKGKGTNTQLLSGLNASEEHFKELGRRKSSPELIHLATHAYFYSSPRANSTIGFKSSENPLIRSGLILAGANKIWKSDESISTKEDGVLTAYEITQMDLSNTKLVVLSACETGLGDIEGSEGVYGLQRAFKIAGVDYLLMSLWSVDDKKTYEFMTQFYEYWQEEGKSIPEAYQLTQNAMRKKYTKPFNPSVWAGFILLQ